MIRGGRIGEEVDEGVAEYTSSLDFDKGIFEYDLLNDMAHVVMLTERGIIKKGDAAEILNALKELLEGEIGRLELDPKKEDIHMVIEDYLTVKIGEVAGKMHTARSRNDQVATDLRMKVRDEVNSTIRCIIDLIRVLLEKSAENIETVMPGYTHLQHAQPTTLGHHYLAYVDALLRCVGRLEEAYNRINLCPLGSAALATTSFDIDRERTAELLGFDAVLENSEDATSTRDFMLEVMSDLSILMIEISRVLEEMILWSSFEFGFIELDDKFASTSSIMPQKKNPDVAEIMRARTSRVLGNLVSTLSSIKSLPYAYSRDLQEVSPLAFDSFEIVDDSLRILTSTLKTIKVNKGRMKELCDANFSTATELADLIVKERGVPFRTAHKIVGNIVSKAIKNGMTTKDIDSKFLDSISIDVMGSKLKIKDGKIKEALDPVESIKGKAVIGGPAPDEVGRMIKTRKKEISEKESRLNERVEKIETSKEGLLDLVRKIAGE